MKTTVISNPPASFIRRLLALFIDTVIIYMTIPYAAPYLEPYMHGTQMLFWNLSSVLAYFLVGFIYYMLFSISGIQATPGKYLLKLYVANQPNAGKITLLQAINRYVTCYLPLFLLLCAFNYEKDFAITHDTKITAEAKQQQKIYDAYNAKIKSHELITEQDKTAVSEADFNSFKQISPLIIPLITALFVLTYYFLMLVMTAGKEKRAYHDLFARTSVLYGRPA